MPPDSAVQELLDRAHIGDTIHAYSDHVDNADIDAVVALFTEDGVLDLGGGAVHRGHPELRDMYADRFTLYTSTSFFSSGIRLVRYDGETATTTCGLQTFHDSADLKRTMFLRGRWEDELVNQAGTWRFRRRHLLVAGMGLWDATEVPPRFSRVQRVRLPQHQG